MSPKQLPHPAPESLSLPEVLAALSDPIRLGIVQRLVDRPGEHAWSELELPVCKSTLSHHVKVLREAGILRHRKDGTRCWIQLNACLGQAFPGLVEAILAHAPPTVGVNAAA